VAVLLCCPLSNLPGAAPGRGVPLDDPPCHTSLLRCARYPRAPRTTPWDEVAEISSHGKSRFVSKDVNSNTRDSQFVTTMSRTFASLMVLVLCSAAFKFVPLSETHRVQEIIDQKRHVRIAFLDLSNKQINSLEDIEFPGSLEKLDLSNNKISSIKGVKFPARLTSLDLSRNQISSIKGVKFPAGLTSLDLGGNAISHIEGVVFPAGLQSLRIDHKLKPFIPRTLLQRVKRGLMNIVFDGETEPELKTRDRSFDPGYSGFKFPFR